MNTTTSIVTSLLLVLSTGCKKEVLVPEPSDPTAFRVTKNITYNNVEVTVVIDKPAQNDLDVLIVFHGTVQEDRYILTAANGTLDNFKAILDRKNMMIVSVAHPQEQILFGENIAQAEAALLWVKNKASQELGIRVGKIFLAGHSQGGYLVTRLNTMHQTNGVIANAPGPLNLVYRCGLEENGQVQPSTTCMKLKNAYGITTSNSTAYFERSLLNFTDGFKSDILFVQGLNDSPIQLYSWPVFKQEVQNCTTCKQSQFFEIAGGHTALFENPSAKAAFNTFINSR